MNDKDFSFPTDAKRVVPSADNAAAPEDDAPPSQEAKEPGAGSKVKAPRTRRAEHPACGCQTNWRMAWVFLLAYLMTMVTIIIIMHRYTVVVQESQAKSTDTIKATVENLGSNFTAAIKDIVRSNQEVVESNRQTAEFVNKFAEGQAKIYAALLEANKRPDDKAAQPAQAKLNKAEKDRVTAMLAKVPGRRGEVEKIRAMIRRNADRDDIVTALNDLSGKVGVKARGPINQVASALEPSRPGTRQRGTPEKVWPGQRGRSSDQSGQ